MIRIRRLLVVGAAAGLLAGLPIGPGAIGTEPEIFGYSMGSAATAVSFLYDQPSFGVPATPTFELRKIHSQATLDSGPSGRALSSVLWPGDLAGNAPLGLALDVFLVDPTRAKYLEPVLARIREVGKAIPGGTYPVRAESFYPQGPQSSEYPAPGGLLMRSKAEQLVSEAVTKVQRVGFPGVFEVGVMGSSAFSGVVRGFAVSEARTHLIDVDLFGGLIHFGEVSSFAKATSDGHRARVEGSVAVAGMRIGESVIALDGKGLHLGSASYDPAGEAARKLIKDELEPRGISLTVTQPIDVVDGAAGSRAVSGLVLRLESKAMAELVEAMPEPFRSWIRSPSRSPLAPIFAPFTPSVAGLVTSPFQFDQSMTIVLGGVAVSSIASPPFDLTLPEVDLGDTLPTDLGTVPPPDLGTLAPSAPSAPQPPARIALPRSRPVAVVGVPAGLGALVMLLGIAGGAGLRVYADRAVASRPATRCPTGKSQ